MWCSFVKMYNSVVNSDVRIAFQKIIIILAQNIRCDLGIAASAQSIVLVTDLKNQLIERLFLLAIFDVVKVILDPTVFSAWNCIPQAPRRTDHHKHL